MTKKHTYREGSQEGMCLDCGLAQKHQAHGRVQLPETTDRGPLARFGALQGDPDAVAKIFQMLTSDVDEKVPYRGLADIAKELGVPKGRFIEWFTTEHAGVYDSALKVIAADLAFRAMEAALGAVDKDNTPAAKLVADTALKLAARFDRLRYGEQGPLAKSIYVIPDAGLLGEAGKLLERLSAPREKIVEEDRNG